ncbi:MAG: DUF4831 family protein [Bacteroidales bacterium]|nr:DUF4831 family protein [Bacteroidales bacterium]
MKKVLILAFSALLLTVTHAGYAQKAAPAGAVIYSLPSTTIHLNVVAERDDFIAGPYAQYAQKYMGAEAPTENRVTYSLKSINLMPYVEADPATRFAINLGGRDVAAANFLQFCSQGLIVMSDSYTGKQEVWRFPSMANNDQFAGKSVEGNLTNTTTTLYRNVATEGGFQRVSVAQTQVVQKSLDAKAAETANAIFNLRKKRVEIITGDTDATFSGEALSAAVAEINRLEEEYMTLFYGVHATSIQEMSFDVVPKAGAEKQMIVAFRISDTQGLLPANNVAGRPIVLELTPDPASVSSTTGATPGRSNDASLVYYRVPATATVNILDGQQILMQARVPVYQSGNLLQFNLNSVVK